MMQALRFCLVTTFYPPNNFGGDGIFVERLARALVRRGHEVHVVHDVDAYRLVSRHAPSVEPEPDFDVNLHPLKRGAIGLLDLVVGHQLGRPVLKRKSLCAVLQDGDFDVIHFHNISLLGGPTLLAEGDAVKLCTLHDYWFVCPMHTLWRFGREACRKQTCLTCAIAGGRPPQLWRYTGVMSSALRHVDEFITGSEFARRKHLELGFQAPIRCIPHFVPDTPDRLEREATWEGPAKSCPFFLYVGRLEKLKGLQVILEQFRSYEKAQLVVAGSGSYEGELRRLADGLPHVRFLGAVDESELDGLYRSAMAVIVPSLCYESFGLVAIESLARGTPVVAHDIGGLGEIIRGSEGGILYRTGEEIVPALEELRREPDRRREMGMRGKAYVDANCTERAHLNRYFALIHEVRERHAVGPRSGPSAEPGADLSGDPVP